jgi:protein TonB
MNNTANLRLASLGASTAMFTALVALALTATMTARLLPDLDFGPPPIPVEYVPPATSPAPAPPSPPRQSSAEEPTVVTAPPISESEPTPFAPTGAVAEAAPGPPTIANPYWLERPDNLTRYYPRRALERGRQGEVVLNCIVGVEGALRCAVVSETPVGWGFGEAALEIAGDHRLAPATLDGRPVEGRYRMVVPFRLQ